MSSLSSASIELEIIANAGNRIINSRFFREVQNLFNRSARDLIVKKQRFTFAEIYAVQLLKEFCSGSDGPDYWLYELNLVKASGERINLVNHSDGNLLLANAVQLAALMECKL